MSAPTTRAATSFRYRAAASDGRTTSGSIVASGASAAAEQLASRGLFPLELVPLPVASVSGLTTCRLSDDDLAVGLHSLATLLEAGLPLSRALSAFESLAPPGWRPLLPEVLRAVREGHGLADALAQGTSGMPPIVLGILRAGEAGSGLANAVRRAADQIEQQTAVRASLHGALAYPAIVAVTGAAAVALMVGIILPRFAALLGDLGQTLPVSTRVVLAVAAATREAALPTLGITLAAWLAWRVWMSSRTARVQWEEFLLAAPLVGRVRLAAATGRVASALGALLDAGIPIAAALRHAAPAAGNAAVEARLLAAREAMLRGSRIADALAAQRALTLTALRLVQTGEETARLATMLSHAARLEAAGVERRLRGAIRLIEPLLVLGLGGIIAIVAAALLQAVYSVRPGP